MALENFFSIHILLALSYVYINAELTLTPEAKVKIPIIGQFGQAKDKCERSILKNLQEQTLCDSPDTEIAPFDQTLNTCANRCGLPKAYKSFLKCACDDKCTIYKDCCSDMHTHCPEIIAKTKHLADKFHDANATCEGHLLAVKENTGKFQLDDTSKRPTMSTEITRTTASFIQTFYSTEYEPLQRPEVKLHHLFETITSLKVADTQLGVIFYDYFAYRFWRRTVHTMAFVPQVITLACVRSNGSSIAKRNILQVIPSCTITATKAITTSLHRGCKWQGKVSCSCKSGFHIEGSLSDACFHQTQLELYLLSRKEQALIPNIAYDTCLLNDLPNYFKSPTEIVTVSEPIVDASFTGTLGILQMAVPLTMKPVVLYGNISAAQFLEDKKLATGAPDEVTNKFRKHQKFLNNLPIEFVVDFAETLEKRIRCPKFNSPLSECSLEECANGIFLVAMPLSPWSFYGVKCMLPSMAIVKGTGTYLNVNTCSCFRVLSVVTSLKVWDAKVMTAHQGQCIFQLVHRPEDNKNDVFNFSDSLKKPTATRFLGQMSYQTLMDRLAEQMNETRDVCKEQTETGFDVCFYSWSADNPEGKELIVCIPLDLKSSAKMRCTRNLIDFLVMSAAMLGIWGFAF